MAQLWLQHLTIRIVNFKKFRFASKVQDTKFTQGPGPGAYSLKASIGNEGTKLTIAPRRADTAKAQSSNVPGPGTYNTGGIRGVGPTYKYCALIHS